MISDTISHESIHASHRQLQYMDTIISTRINDLDMYVKITGIGISRGTYVDNMILHMALTILLCLH